MEQKPTNKRNADFLSGIVCYTLWGLLPLYWHLMDEIGPVVILANRIVWSMVFTAMLLLITKRFGEVVRLLRDRRKMRFMVPAALMITINWGVYIWAVNSGHVLDASLGYYLNPLVVFALGIVLFRANTTRGLR